jgi:hypothetical protein
MSSLLLADVLPFTDALPASWPDELLVAAAVASYGLAPPGRAVSAFDEAIRTEVDRRRLRRQTEWRLAAANEELSRLPEYRLQHIA